MKKRQKLFRKRLLIDDYTRLSLSITRLYSTGFRRNRETKKFTP